MSSLVNVLLLAGLALAAPSPSPTMPASPSNTTFSSAATHTIAVGKPFAIEPNNIFAATGDILEFHFAAGTNAIAQSTFDMPCEPLTGGFSSGVFTVVADQTQSSNVFVVTVQDTTQPLWFYLAAGDKCNALGMVGVVNAHTDSPQNILSFMAAAKKANGTMTVGTVSGGVVVPNPKPNTGI